MTHIELKQLRHRIGFSMGDLSKCMGLKKSTYQRYEDGTAAIPSYVERAALETEQIAILFMETAPARIDARINREFPLGFHGEAPCE